MKIDIFQSLKFLRNKSFREKIVIIVMLVIVVSLLVVSVLFTAIEIVTYRYTITEDLANLGEFISANIKTDFVEKNKVEVEF